MAEWTRPPSFPLKQNYEIMTIVGYTLQTIGYWWTPVVCWLT